MESIVACSKKARDFNHLIEDRLKINHEKCDLTLKYPCAEV